MEIILNRNIKVKKFKALIDMGIKEKRTEIIALLMIAKSHGEELSKKIICDEFIFRDNKTIAKRILQRCQDLGVIDEDLKVTEDGIDAREDGMIYRPYTGTYYIWTTKDPLIPQKILNVEMVDEKIKFKEEIKGFRWKYENGAREKVEVKIEKNIEILPEWLKNTEKIKHIKLLDDNNTEIRIEHIEEKVEPISVSEDLKAQIKITNNSKTIKFTGLFKDERDISIFPDIRSVWKQILKNRYKHWDWDDKTLKVTFNELKEKEIISFIKKFDFDSPSIEKFGIFNSFSLNLNIKPQSDADAELWANWLLENQIKEYMFPSEFEKYKKGIYKKLKDYNIKLQTIDELSKKFINKILKEEVPNDFWFVRAPLDLFPIKIEGDD